MQGNRSREALKGAVGLREEKRVKFFTGNFEKAKEKIICGWIKTRHFFFNLLANH